MYSIYNIKYMYILCGVKPHTIYTYTLYYKYYTYNINLYNKFMIV